MLDQNNRTIYITQKVGIVADGTAFDTKFLSGAVLFLFHDKGYEKIIFFEKFKRWIVGWYVITCMPELLS